MPQDYRLVIRAEGEVRDADGNLIGSVEGQTVVTEEQAKQILEALEKEKS